MSRLARAALIVASGALLVGCADVHPGAAAVVDGRTLSMSAADRAATAYCQLSIEQAQQQGSTAAVAAADSRRQAVSDYVTWLVAKKVAKRDGLSIDPAQYVLTTAQRAQVRKAFPHAKIGPIYQAIERSQQSYVIEIALGSAATGQAATSSNTDALEAAGSKELGKAFDSASIHIDPRFGLDPVTQKVVASGSLSVPASSKTTSADSLPASQRCS